MKHIGSNLKGSMNPSDYCLGVLELVSGGIYKCLKCLKKVEFK